MSQTMLVIFMAALSLMAADDQARTIWDSQMRPSRPPAHHNASARKTAPAPPKNRLGLPLDSQYGVAVRGLRATLPKAGCSCRTKPPVR